jgi:hypothetical protein
MLRRVLAVAPLAALVLVLACASPTLPLPPPEIPTVGMGADANHVLLTATCGGVEGGAEVVVVNNTAPPLEKLRGAYATTCGSWQAEIWAHSGDVLEITQVVGGESSQVTTMQVR